MLRDARRKSGALLGMRYFYVASTFQSDNLTLRRPALAGRLEGWAASESPYRNSAIAQHRHPMPYRPGAMMPWGSSARFRLLQASR